MTATTKMQHALASLDRRLGLSWEQAQLAKTKNSSECKARLDRFEVTSSKFEEALILEIPGFQRNRKYLLRRKKPTDFLPYRRRTDFTTNGSISQVVVLSEPSTPRIASRKVSLVARDESGLCPKDVLGVLEILPNSKLVLIELAFDFGFSSGVDGAYVRTHALFGKSRPNQVGVRRGWDSWGTRRGSKFIRSYLKQELQTHRLELQLNRKFIHRHRIRDIFEFHRLAEILPRHHIWFVRLDMDRALQHVRSVSSGPERVRSIRESLEDVEGDLYKQCSVLRRRGGLMNVRRVLVPLRTNRLIRQAIDEWATQWPQRPNRLEVRS